MNRMKKHALPVSMYPWVGQDLNNQGKGPNSETCHCCTKKYL